MKQSLLEEHFFDELLSLLQVNSQPGKLINIDTIDGGGNSTQAAFLCDYLRDTHGVPVILTREPTDDQIGFKIREVLQKQWQLPPVPFQLLFSADRGHHLDTLISPALERGDWVVTARYALSTLAFGMSHGIPAWQLLAMNISYPWPNLNLVLTVSPEECLQRKVKQQGQRKLELHEVRETLEKTLEIYQLLAGLIPCTELVDGTGTEAEVFARVQKIVDERLLP
ncbi:MAG: dTMP kinase [Patescibacteria group bacterium]|nr:MAG: dTMP kinase [Patescibacteria group bacterium]